MGGNTFRTWGAQELDETINGMPLLDYADSLGLKVIAGIWIGHERHGFDYTSKQQIDQQRDHVRETIRKHKSHPALLAWGLGNEMEGPADDGSNTRIWKELNELAKIVKKGRPKPSSRHSNRKYRRPKGAEYNETLPRNRHSRCQCICKCTRCRQRASQARLG